MKHIKLECSTRGHAYGEVIPVGGKGEISVKEAESLIADKMAVEYTQPVASLGSDKALEAKVAKLEKENAELIESNGVLKAKVTELETIIAAVNNTVDGKDAGTK